MSPPTTDWQAQMTRDDLLALIEHPYHLRIPAHPDTPADVFFAHLVIGTLDLDVTVSVDPMATLLGTRKQACGQGLQSGLLRGPIMDPDLLLVVPWILL